MDEFFSRKRHSKIFLVFELYNPERVLYGQDKIDPDLCTQCGTSVQNCPNVFSSKKKMIPSLRLMVRKKIYFAGSALILSFKGSEA